MANITSYTWTLPEGASIVAGNNSRVITVNFAPTASNGNITVSGISLCGNSPPSPNFPITINRNCDQNYVKTTEPRIAGLNLPEEDNSVVNFQFIDGLGRPMQNLTIKASPNNKDIVQIIEYDNSGREAVKYMPFAIANNGGYINQTEAITKNTAFYKAMFNVADGEEKFTAVTDFEPSPLSRPIEQGSPGKDWRITVDGQIDFTAHSSSIQYNSNTDNDKIIRWKVDGATLDATSIKNDGFYPAATLYVTTTTDEDHKSTKEYKNTLGQVVLTERQGGLRTYNVYDDFGQLRCVIPPEANGIVDDEYCYYYNYDAKHRMIEKKIPGALPVYMAYDKQDRLVLSQDGNLRKNNDWMLSQYNLLGWPIASGIYTDKSSPTRTRKKMEDDYAVSFVESADFKALTKTYYSTYHDTILTAYPFKNEFNLTDSFNIKIKGLVTYTQTRILDTDEWLITVNYYDKEYRVIQTQGQNQLGGLDMVSNKYDFTGQLLETKHKHTTSLATHTIAKRFTYDHAGRLLTTEMAMDGAAYNQIALNKYNELGQLIEKDIHKNADESYLITSKLDYNIRGWLTIMNNTNKAGGLLFEQELMYNINSIRPANKLYNGNISAMQWNSAKLNGEKSFDFTYDGTERITEAIFKGTEGEMYSNFYGYDKNGNLKFLNRDGLFTDNSFGQIDKLEYGYKGNQLIKVNDMASDSKAQLAGFSDNGLQNTGVPTDATTHEYLYDDNGNLITDHNKQIEEIDYNYLNLPKSIDLSNNNYIEYVYDAAGIKLQQKVFRNANLEKETDYVGNYVYENGSLAYILTDDGRMVADPVAEPVEAPGVTTFKYEYFIKDHLGNTRAVVADNDNNGLVEVQQETHYYPFGLAMEGLSYQNPLQTNKNKIKYQGQELQEELDLGWYQFKWRMADPEIGRFSSIDPLAEKYTYNSPYAFSENRVIDGVEMEGLEVFIDRSGYILNYGPNKNDMRVYMNYMSYNVPVGEIGKTIDANIWFRNLLQENSKIADLILDPYFQETSFNGRVRKFGEWDYKYRSPANQNQRTRQLSQHIIGLAFYHKDADKQNGGLGDLPETHFLFDGKDGRAEDLNNFHFGVVGDSYGLFTETFMLKTAGGKEMEKWEKDYNSEVPESWRPTREVLIGEGFYNEILLPPYGDNPTDYEWINYGFDYYNSHDLD